jgi:antitoxin component YwqK of YwqJK toxin-antitoxin module
MNTLLGFLDWSSIFQLLVRLHYPDLINLCKAKPYLWKITWTSWFIDSWKKYNVRTVETKTKTKLITKELDRLNWPHGKMCIYKGDKLYKEYVYIYGILESSQARHKYHHYFDTYTYLEGNVHMNRTVYRDDGQVTYICYNNNVQNGLTRYYDSAGGWTWIHFSNGQRHGLYMVWSYTGKRKYMGNYKNGQNCGMHYYWTDASPIPKKIDYTIRNYVIPVNR